MLEKGSTQTFISLKDSMINFKSERRTLFVLVKVRERCPSSISRAAQKINNSHGEKYL